MSMSSFSLWRSSARIFSLELVQDVMFLFGRAYPAGWTDDGSAFHCIKVEWLGKDGRVLATSDFEN